MKTIGLCISFLLALSVSGCKQGDGEVCQIDEDCESGNCNAGTGRCQSGGGSVAVDAAIVVDGAVVPDASMADAAPNDAAVPDAAN